MADQVNFMAGKGSKRRAENTPLVRTNWDAIDWENKPKTKWRPEEIQRAGKGDAPFRLTQPASIPPWTGSTIEGLTKAAKEFAELNGEALRKASEG